jgi:CheY-like chemotaxis protein
MLNGLRILVVEDEALIAMLLEEFLAEAGAEVLGPVDSVAGAFALMRPELPDAAVLDINLGQETSAKVASALSAAGVPFVVATGYGAHGIAPEYGNATVVPKPYMPDDLIEALAGAYGRDRITGGCKSLSGSEAPSTWIGSATSPAPSAARTSNPTTQPTSAAAPTAAPGSSPRTAG